MPRWKIEEQYRKKGKDKDAVPTAEFRQECRDFAAHWLAAQSAEFQRLGVLGDWQSPYTTMAYDAEAKIAEELGKILMDGSLYCGAKPVMWSPVEKTALAEAEMEYEDHTSVTIYALWCKQVFWKCCTVLVLSFDNNALDTRQPCHCLW